MEPPSRRVECAGFRRMRTGDSPAPSLARVCLDHRARFHFIASLKRSGTRVARKVDDHPIGASRTLPRWPYLRTVWRPGRCRESANQRAHQWAITLIDAKGRPFERETTAANAKELFAWMAFQVFQPLTE
jgi:hypothetical protein